MREYAVVSASVLGSPKQLADWLGRSLAYVRSLPPKAAGSKAKQGRASL
jgi:hypothetical protein